MFSKLIRKLTGATGPSPSNPQEIEYLNYLSSSYPNNHNYKVKKNKLIPSRELAKRSQRIQALLPDPLTSLVDIGCSKGYFVFAGSEQPTCKRCLGVDVYQYDIDVCRWLKDYLHHDKVHFEKLALHELAERIDEFGGPFQTALVINQYQYLYFGSARCPDRYLDHEEIFKHLSKICNRRLIFNNRVNLADCQNIESISLASEKSQDYSEEKILAAASKYFNVIQQGSLGQYPLWILNAKAETRSDSSSTSSTELRAIFEKWSNDLEFREQFKKNPEQALASAGFKPNADTLEQIKSMLKLQSGKSDNEELDKRINR